MLEEINELAEEISEADKFNLFILSGLVMALVTGNGMVTENLLNTAT